MANPDPDIEQVRLQEHPLPGAARLWELTLDDGTVLQIVKHAAGGESELGVLPPGADEAAARARLTQADATTLAGLLSGIRFVGTPGDGATGADHPS